MERTSPGTDSTEALTKIEDWIRECTEDHADSLCDSVYLPQLPKRVVDVGLDNNTVKLVEPQDTLENYICLSHCWGVEQIITTTVTTIHQRKRGIAWNDLSTTV
jgi:hypothetical protein